MSLAFLRAFFEGKGSSDALTSLRDLYARLAKVNRAFAERIRAAHGDAHVNAIVNLFTLGVCVGDELDSQLEGLRETLFASG